MKKTIDIFLDVEYNKKELPERGLFLSVILQALLDATNKKSKVHRDKASNSNNHLKKPVKCTKENGDIVIFNGSREIVKAGYDDSVIHKLAKGGKQIRKDRPNGKGYTIRKKHKDIIKVEFI